MKENKTLIDRLRDRDDIKPALYGRVSTYRQFTVGFGLDSQIKTGQETLARLGINPIQDMRIFTDGGVSGTVSDRDEFNELKDAIKKTEINLIIVANAERIGRDEIDNFEFKRFIKKYGCEILFTYNTGLDIYSLDGEFQYDLDTVLGTREIKQTRLRAVHGLIQSFDIGNYANPGAPYGYDKFVDKKNKKTKLIINEKQAKAVQIIHNLKLKERLSVDLIKSYLTVHKIDEDTQWSQYRIRKILLNPVYCDIVIREDLQRTWSGTGIVPVLVSIEDKEAIHKIMKEQSRGKSRKANKHLYHGMVFCSACEQYCINDTSKKKYKYYYCTQCKKRINETALDDSIAEYIILNSIQEYNEAEYKSMRRSLLRLEKDSKTFEDLYDKRLITKKAMREGLKNVHQQRKDYLTVIADKVDHKVNWYALGKKAKNKLLYRYIERIDVSLSSKSIVKIQKKRYSYKRAIHC